MRKSNQHAGKNPPSRTVQVRYVSLLRHQKLDPWGRDFLSMPL